MVRRIYTIVKGKKPEGQVNVHNSTCMTIPTLGWATSSWDGEQFGSIARGADVTALLPLDAFRCEFMGRQWGVPAEFLCYERPYTTHEAFSFTLLHDVLVQRDPPQKQQIKILSGPQTDGLGYPAVSTLLKEHQGRRYLLAANPSRGAVRARVNAGVGTGQVQVMFEDRWRTGKAGGWEDDFAPYAVHVYSW